MTEDQAEYWTSPPEEILYKQLFQEIYAASRNMIEVFMAQEIAQQVSDAIIRGRIKGVTWSRQ